MASSPLDHLISGLRSELDHLVNGLQAGLLSPAEWHNGTLQVLADYHSAAYLAGADQDRLDQAGQQLVLKTLADQVDYLGRFTDAVEAGDLSDAQIRSRAAQYAQPLRTTYSQAETAGADLPFYPADGGTECGVHCRCSWEQRGGSWYWVMDPLADHCEDCRARADGSPYEG